MIRSSVPIAGAIGVLSLAGLAFGVGAAGLFVYDGTFPNRIWEIDETIPAVENRIIIGVSVGVPEFEFFEGFFYANHGTGPNLYKIDPATGALLQTITVSYPVGGNVITAMEGVGATLYGGFTTIGGGSSRLVTINVTTGVVTPVGGGMGIADPLGGLAYDESTSTMYAVNAREGGPARLYTVNLVTGAATLLGTVTPSITVTGLEMGEDGVLYLLGRGTLDDNYLFSVNPTTLASIRLGLMSGLSNATAITSRPLPPPPCPEDVNDDGVVDLTDLSTLLFNFGQASPPAQGDVNGSGVVDLNDLSAILFNFGLVCP
jgi:hypothetical protein